MSLASDLEAVASQYGAQVLVCPVVFADDMMAIAKIENDIRLRYHDWDSIKKYYFASGRWLLVLAPESKEAAPDVTISTPKE